MNGNREHINDELLVRYLLGEASGQEILDVEHWLKKSEHNKKYFDHLESIWLESGKLPFRPVDVDRSQSWTRLSTRIDAHEQQVSQPKTISFRSRAFRISASVAAAIVFLVGIYQLFIISPQPETIKYAATHSVVKDTLPDGSLITLNKNTLLTYVLLKDESQRMARLNGEAFFDVRHNPKKPFIVEAGGAYLKVLGTSFNVKTSEKNLVEIVVTEGKVKLFMVDSLSNDTASVLLKKGMKGQIAHGQKQPQIIDTKAPDELFWFNRRLVFDETRLEEVFLILQKHYNITIETDDVKTGELKLTTIFTNEPIDSLLKVIETTFDLELLKKDNTYIFKRKNDENN